MRRKAFPSLSRKKPKASVAGGAEERQGAHASAGRRCTAKSKRSGKRCGRKAVPGYSVCYYHGANPGNPGGCPPEKAKGNRNAFKHGVYAKHILNDEEQRVFDDIVRADNVSLSDSAGSRALQALGMAFVQFIRAVKTGHVEAAERFDRRIRKHLRALKVARMLPPILSGGTVRDEAVRREARLTQ